MPESKLRTLKEIKPSLYFMDSENSLKDDLRSAAREWIKEMDEEKIDYENKKYGLHDNILDEFWDSEYNDFGKIQKWIKFFFNLDGGNE